MPLKAKERILPIHAAAVITHHDQTGASAGIIDPDPRSSGIKAVLDEFLDQRSGSLDDLPGRDLTGHDIGKETDFAHFVENVPHLRSSCSKKPKESLSKLPTA